MEKPKKSGPAKLMYGLIAVTAVAAAVCFWLYYGTERDHGAILWIGVAAFTTLYHLWVRLLMGNVTKLFSIHHKQWWFRERGFEKRLYKVLHVKNWKDKALTYNPELFSLKERTLEEIADTTAKAETDHWVNILIALSTVLFSIPWGMFWLFLLTALGASLFDSQFILIQRYNRPRLVRAMARQSRAVQG